MNAPEPVDIDPLETREWIDALRAAVAAAGTERGLFLLRQLEEHLLLQQLQQAGI